MKPLFQLMSRMPHQEPIGFSYPAKDGLENLHIRRDEPRGKGVTSV
jgi:hypothetical protein